MRRVLVLGGTGWLGGEIARAALAGGAEVTCLARGVSGDVPAGVRLVRADRAEPGAYDDLGGEWDDVIEVGSEPDLVASALTALADRARHWTYVSTVSVYRDHDEVGADETAALVEPADMSEYPDAKVAAERASVAAVGDRLLIARPGLIVGPGDPSDRFGYWPARLHRGGRVLVPPARHVQVIDVADLATWIVRAGRGGDDGGDATTGTVNAIGEPIEFDALLEGIAQVTGFDGELVRADASWLLERGVNYWAGVSSLPLWVPEEMAAMSQRSTAAFRAAGGRTRPVQETIERVLTDEIARGVGRERHSGLPEAEESELLADLG